MAQLLWYIYIFIHYLPVIKVRQFWISFHYFFNILSHNSYNIVNLERKVVNLTLMQRNSMNTQILYNCDYIIKSLFWFTCFRASWILSGSSEANGLLSLVPYDAIFRFQKDGMSVSLLIRKIYGGSSLFNLLMKYF